MFMGKSYHKSFAVQRRAILVVKEVNYGELLTQDLSQEASRLRVDKSRNLTGTASIRPCTLTIGRCTWFPNNH